MNDKTSIKFFILFLFACRIQQFLRADPTMSVFAKHVSECKLNILHELREFPTLPDLSVVSDRQSYIISQERKKEEEVMALELLKSAKAVLRTDQLIIDSLVFKLHYRASVALLIGCSLVGVAKQYFGDPINCQVGNTFNPTIYLLSLDISRLLLGSIVKCWMITAGFTLHFMSGQSSR